MQIEALRNALSADEFEALRSEGRQGHRRCAASCCRRKRPRHDRGRHGPGLNKPPLEAAVRQFAADQSLALPAAAGVDAEPGEADEQHRIARRLRYRRQDENGLVLRRADKAVACDESGPSPTALK